MAEFKINRGLQVNYDAIPVKDGDAIYVCVDTGFCYLGDKLLSPRAKKNFDSGLKVFYSGVDVTNSEALPYIVRSCEGEWYGSQGSYETLVENDNVNPNILYHIQVQADWDEKNPNSLAFIKNKTRVMDATTEPISMSSDKLLSLFYATKIQ